ncbi:hypothetical protein [Kordiimonas marina]|uniref:hypothetical protein n=1 Tax=Kordiimonas marina TaxID=2872312 RepID=UPI001FF68D24|nr:hypothetical protein [Kordiimonas marina]MCJ9430215.1 hypothetical protein [Kordiimonas marina]
MTASKPYELPKKMSPELERVVAYWRSLLRGSAEMPFADDLSLEALPDMAPRLALVEVFTLPERFRLSFIGGELATKQTEPLLGKYLDEVELYFPLEFLRSQASATVESASPTCHAQAASKDGEHAAYSRLMLPMWGDGHISLILVALDWD